MADITYKSSGNTNSTDQKIDEKDQKNQVFFNDVEVNEIESIKYYEAVEEDEFHHDRSRLKQGLKQRHLQMIALVNVFGTGIFLSSGGILATSGPLGTVLAYGLCAVLVGMNQIAMAEVCCLMPTSSAIIRHLEHFFDPAMSFAYGWVSIWGSIMPNEISAAAVIVSYWSDLSQGIWIAIIMVLIFALNMLPIRYFGEVEFGFACIKMLLLVGLIICSIVMTSGGGPNHKTIGFQYWRDPGPMVSYLTPGALGRFAGFIKVLSNGVVYSYGGVQSVSNLGAEVKFPRRTIFRSCKRVLYRVAVLMILAAFSLTMIIPSNNKQIASSSGNAKSSPFVVAMNIAGIKVLPHIVNGAVLTSAFSTGNQAITFGARSLFALAVKNQAPKVFLKTTKRGVPWVGNLFCSLFMPLAFMNLSTSSATVFSWFQSIVSAKLLFEWCLISVNHVCLSRAMRAQGYSREQLPHTMKFAEIGAWISGIWSGFLLLVGGFKNFVHGQFDIGSLFSSYFIFPLVFFLYFGYKFIKKTSVIKSEEVELEKLFKDVEQNPEPPFEKMKGLKWLTILWS